jgi:phosphonate transport system substrate-binding protein
MKTSEAFAMGGAKGRNTASLYFGGLLLAAVLALFPAARADAAPRKNLVLAVDLESYLEQGATQATLLLRYKPFQDYMEKETGMKVEIYGVTEQAAVTEALRAGKADISSFSPYRFVLAAKRCKMEPVAFQGDLKTGALAFYYSYIVAAGDSSINSMADIKAHSKELTFGFQDPASTSGTFIPKINLIKNGINPDTDFKEVTSGNEDLVVAMAVKSGKTSLCATSNSSWDKIHKNGQIKPGELKIIHKSDPILKTVVGVRAELDPKLKLAIQNAYVQMAVKSPAALACATGDALYNDGSTPSFKYIAPTDEIRAQLAEFTKIAQENGL